MILLKNIVCNIRSLDKTFKPVGLYALLVHISTMYLLELNLEVLS